MRARSSKAAATDDLAVAEREKRKKRVDLKYDRSAGRLGHMVSQLEKERRTKYKNHNLPLPEQDLANCMWRESEGDSNLLFLLRFFDWKTDHQIK